MALKLPISLERFWEQHGVALCCEAQGDGVPCPMLGRDCETCERALKSLYAQYADPAEPAVDADPVTNEFPECGP